MVEKLRKIDWENYLPLLAAFLLPLVIAVVVCIDHGVYPFGDRSILQVDMYHQYCPFLTEFMEKLKNGESLLYSFHIGLGADFVSLYAYYLASPLNWFVILCPEGFVIEFMTILTLLKFALCGLTFAYYLKYHYGKNQFAISIFATAYALSGYMAAYSWNIMWTDCLVLLPLIVLGLERLVKEGKCSLYYITLAVCIFSNYYISILICIFLVLYFVILWLECEEGRLKAVLNFGWYSLLAGGTGAVLIIPEAIILGASGSGKNDFPDTMEWYFNILAEMSRHLLLSESYTTGYEHWPNLYCGVFVLLFFVLYLLNSGISWKKKIKRVLFLALFLVSFANNILDFIWHGFHFPEALPGRQAFIYIFLVLVLSYEVFLHREKIKLWHIFASLAADMAFLYASYRAYSVSGLAGEKENSEAAEGFSFFGAGFDFFDITAIFLMCYALILIFMVFGKQKIKEIMQLMLFLMILTEITVHFDTEGLGTSGRSYYIGNYKDYKNLLEIAEEREKAASGNGEVFYRIEQFERKTKNDAALYAYPSGTQFSSLMNLDVSHIYQYVGMEGGKNFYCYNGAIPLISSMLSVKYMLADNAFEENPIRSLVAESGDVYLYQNHYSLPLGYMVSKEVIENWNYGKNSDVTNVNNLATLLGAETSIMSPIESVDEEGVTTIEAWRDGYVFVSYDKTSISSLKEEISDGRTKDFSKVSHNYFLDLGYVHAGDVIKLTNSSEETLNTHAFMIDMEALDTAYQTLNEQTMELTENSITKISGTIDVKEAGYLVLSIAKEAGWTLYVDGKEQEPEVFAEAFMSVYLEKGTHTIELRYETPGLRLGALISLGCVAAFLMTMAVKRKRRRLSLTGTFS